MKQTDNRNTQLLIRRIETILGKTEALQQASVNGRDRASEKIGYAKRELMEAWHILEERLETPHR